MKTLFEEIRKKFDKKNYIYPQTDDINLRIHIISIWSTQLQ
jgi:hypothetical protein